ncbi:MAG: hypothetical protein NT040_12695 [Bacteroidetes bacterium]|nr:hypothetical protein [Bacteroidota bacterium]
MEKIMIFGVAIWFGLMITIAPQVVQKHPTASTNVGVSGTSMDKMVTSRTSADKPIRQHEHATFWCSPE